MRNFEVSELLEKKLRKLSKKDKSLYQQVMKKIKEVVNSGDVEHYKNLRYNLRASKRVHVGHFVLVFQYDKGRDLVKFDDFDHHDNIYRK
jgi:mRNA-degrading endonuclease RelE of RelBE toxin-antitoxin system